jgi:hypothetical protein
MAYEIVFVEKPEPVDESGRLHRGPQKDRGVAESVFLSSLPTNPKVFAFFYRGSTDWDEVEKRLRALGQKTGDNFFVNIGTLADPDYPRAQERFQIEELPVIVVTAISPLAATPAGDNAFVRLDNRSLFEKPDELIRTVEELFNLFLGGKISRAVATGWKQEGKAALSAATQRIWSVIKPVITWVAERDLVLEFLGVKIEVKDSGGH